MSGKKISNWDGVSYRAHQPRFAHTGGRTRCAICQKSKPDEPVLTLDWIKRYGVARPRVHNSCAVNLMKTTKPASIANADEPRRDRPAKGTMAWAIETGEVLPSCRYPRPWRA